MESWCPSWQLNCQTPAPCKIPLVVKKGPRFFSQRWSLWTSYQDTESTAEILLGNQLPNLGGSCSSILCEDHCASLATLPFPGEHGSYSIPLTGMWPISLPSQIPLILHVYTQKPGIPCRNPSNTLLKAYDLVHSLLSFITSTSRPICTQIMSNKHSEQAFPLRWATLFSEGITLCVCSCVCVVDLRTLG